MSPLDLKPNRQCTIRCVDGTYVEGMMTSIFGITRKGQYVRKLHDVCATDPVQHSKMYLDDYWIAVAEEDFRPWEDSLTYQRLRKTFNDKREQNS